MTETQPAPSPADQAAFLLRLSARPVLLAGAGARSSGAGDVLAGIAELVDAPVVTTWAGKSVLGDSHDMAAGALFGQPEARSLLESADAVLVVGVSFDDSTGDELAMPAQLIQIDLDDAQLGKRFPLRLGIGGDAKEVLEEVMESLRGPSPLRGAPGDRTQRAPDGPTGSERDGAVRAREVRRAALARAQKQGPGQISALQTLRAAIHPGALVAGFPGSSRSWTAPFFETPRADTWLTGEDPARLFEIVRDRSAQGPVVALCDSPDLAEHLTRLDGCKALTVIAFLHGGEKPTKLLQSCLSAGFSTILVDTPTEIAAALTVMMPSGSPSAILASYRWDRG